MARRQEAPNFEKRPSGIYFRLRAPEGHDGPARPRFGPYKTERAALKAWAAKLDEFDSFDPRAPKPVEIPTLDVLADEFLAGYHGAENTKRALGERIRYARRTFGSTRIDRISVGDVAKWRAETIAEIRQGGRDGNSVWGVHKALRQLLAYAVATDRLADNVARRVPNPEPRRAEVVPFDYLSDVEAIADELPDRYRVVPIFAALTGLRPEEWIPLRAKDLDLRAGVVYVRRIYTRGLLKPSPEKGKGARRAVPLPAEVVALMRSWPVPLDPDGLIFPAFRGGLIDLHAWRAKHWNPAVHAAGLAVCKCGHKSGDHSIERRRPGCEFADCACEKFERVKGSPTPYTLRHTYAAHMIAAGVPTDTLARFMGTSVGEIEKTYGHLLRDSADLVRGLADAYLAKLREREAIRPAS